MHIHGDNEQIYCLENTCLCDYSKHVELALIHVKLSSTKALYFHDFNYKAQ